MGVMKLPTRHEVMERLNQQPRPAKLRPEDRYSGESFADLDALVGTVVLLGLSRKRCMAVRVEELELVREERGFVVLSRLRGPRVWGPPRLKGADIDQRERYPKTWKRIATLEGTRVGVPESEWQFDIERCRFTRLGSANRFYAALAELSAHDVVRHVRYSSEIETAIVGAALSFGFCTGVLTFECVNWACAGYCAWSGADPVVGNCNCQASGFCAWTPMGTRCISSGCGTCYNPFGWSALCPCF
jgi:hypothetical protein